VRESIAIVLRACEANVHSRGVRLISRLLRRSRLDIARAGSPRHLVVALSFTFNGKERLASKKATNPAWTKYRAYEATSAHWYTPEQFERYAGALIANDEKITVREFCAQFRGMSSTERQRQVLAESGRRICD
jgi:hypothetical protein